jgi:hypothetical protein
MVLEDEQLKKLAKESEKYFQSVEAMSENKEFWKECKELSIEWLNLLNENNLTSESVRTFTEKLERLSNKDSSHWLFHIRNVIQSWVASLSFSS